MAISAIALACALGGDAYAQDPAASASGHSATTAAPAGKPKAGAKKKGGKPVPDTTAAPDAPKPDAPPAGHAGTGKRKPGAKGPDAPEAPKPDAAASSGPRAPHDVVEHESRIEFDERMVKGQTAAGAIYLFQRAPTEFKSIVQVPDSFRSRTTGMLASRRTAP